MKAALWGKELCGDVMGAGLTGHGVSAGAQGESLEYFQDVYFRLEAEALGDLRRGADWLATGFTMFTVALAAFFALEYLAVTAQGSNAGAWEYVLMYAVVVSLLLALAYVLKGVTPTRRGFKGLGYLGVYRGRGATAGAALTAAGFVALTIWLVGLEVVMNSVGNAYFLPFAITLFVILLTVAAGGLLVSLGHRRCGALYDTAQLRQGGTVALIGFVVYLVTAAALGGFIGPVYLLAMAPLVGAVVAALEVGGVLVGTVGLFMVREGYDYLLATRAGQ